VRVVLLRVGIDAGAGGMQGPLFRDGSFEFVPIPGAPDATDPRTYGNTRGRLGRFLVDYFPPARRAGIADVHTHADPEFETFTYGDPTKSKRSLRRLVRGDLLVFYAGLEGWDYPSEPALYLVGYFEVQVAGLASSFSDTEIEDLFRANAHVIDRPRFAEQRDRLILVKGGPGSRLLSKAVRVSDMGLNSAGAPLKVLSNGMRDTFGEFGGKDSLQRSNPRWVKAAHEAMAARFVRELERGEGPSALASVSLGDEAAHAAPPRLRIVSSPRTFNELLSSASLDPTRVKLVRHTDDKRGMSYPSLYDTWNEDPDMFEAYQRIQTRHRFEVGDYVASFVVSPPPERDTICVGLYHVTGEGRCRSGMHNPYSLDDVSGLYLYNLEPDGRLAAYRDRLVVDWGPGFRTWCQRADLQDKPILKIR
jgi:hypothetical protein